MKVNCIVIEDEPLALKKIEQFIFEVKYLSLLQGFNNTIEAIEFLKTNSVDLIFLDIRMKKLSGIQFLEALHIKPKVIITSAYDEYALKGYELEVADYLLKPFSFERFLKSVEKVYKQILDSKINISSDFLFVKTESRIEKIKLNDILFVQGMKDYLQIHTITKKIMTLQTFKNLTDLLPKNNFQRVHNSYVISISKIDSIEKNKIKIGNALIPISDSYKEAFYKLLKEYRILM